MKKIFLITFILMIILSGCESNAPKGNKRIGDDLLPDYSITTMPPHSYAEISGTYMESLISAGESMYDSIYESMYPTQTDRWDGMQAVTGISIQKIESITMPPNNDMIPVTQVCVRNPTEEEFERLLSDIIAVTTVTTVTTEDEEQLSVTTSVPESEMDTTTTSSSTKKKTTLVAVTADTAHTTTTTVS